MALNDTLQRNVGARWRVQLEWSAVQDVANNRSTVTARIYWISLDQYGRVDASAYNPVSITINGDTKSATAQSKLSAGQKKLLLTHSVVIPHNSDGSKQFTISGAYNVNAQLAGIWYYNQTVSGTYTLNSIPRGSSISSNASWTAGSEKTVTITRHSSSFAHKVIFYVKNRAGTWVAIKTINVLSNTTSGSSNFTTAQHQQIFDTLDGRASADTRLVLETYSANTMYSSQKIDTSEKTGTVTAPIASTILVPTGFNIGAAFGVTLNRAHVDFVHTIHLKRGSTILKTYSGLDRSFSFNTSDIANTLYNATPNSNSLGLTLEVLTYYGSELVRTATTKAITARVTNSDPDFSGTPLYADRNQVTLNITGNDQYIVSKKSFIEVVVPNYMRALAKNGATMKEYTVTLGGKSVTRPYSNSTNVIFDIGTIDPTTNQTMVIEAVDSRGNKTLVTKLVTVLPYNPPSGQIIAERRNGFETTTDLIIKGLISSLNVNGSNKNNLLSVSYATRQIGSGSWTSDTTKPTTGYPTFSTGKFSIELDRIQGHEIRVKITDLLGTTTIYQTITSGKPIMHIDEYLKSVGFGDFPDSGEQIFINMGVKFGSNNFASTGAALDMNNSDIIGANGIYMNDQADAGGEGFNFLKTGSPQKSLIASDYDNFRILDGQIILNGQMFATLFDSGLTSGDGLSIGAGGRTIIGGGEAAENLMRGLVGGYAIEEMHVASDNNVYIETDLQNGVDTRQTWIFHENGIFYRPRYKEGNGYNTASVRVAPNHNDPMLFQTMNINVDMANTASSYADITFPVLFDGPPDSVIAQPINNQSFAFHSAVYNITSSGCRVYLRQTDSNNSAAVVTVNLLILGRRG